MTPPLSIRLRVNGNWVICAPNDDDTKWTISVMDVRSKTPSDPNEHIKARETLLRVLSDLRAQVWEEIKTLKNNAGF